MKMKEVIHGLLVHEMEGDAGETYRRLVVPRVRQADILKMAHDHPMAGHLAYKKLYGSDVHQTCHELGKMFSHAANLVPSVKKLNLVGVV